MGLYTSENWEKRFEQDISILSDAELVAEFSTLMKLLDCFDSDDFHYFRFEDEINFMELSYLGEIAKRFVLYVEENTVLPEFSSVADSLSECPSDVSG